VIDTLEIGQRGADGEVVAMGFTEDNGPAYPFSLAEKLERITEPIPGTPRRCGSFALGARHRPMEMISVLANKSGVNWPVRSPALGCSWTSRSGCSTARVRRAALQRRTRDRRALQSRRTESYWTKTVLSDTDTGEAAAVVLLHSGVFKESYPGYPKDRLS